MTGVNISIIKSYHPGFKDFMDFNCQRLGFTMTNFEFPGFADRHYCYIDDNGHAFGICYHFQLGNIIAIGCEYPYSDTEIPDWMESILSEYIRVVKKWVDLKEPINFKIQYTYFISPNQSTNN